MVGLDIICRYPSRRDMLRLGVVACGATAVLGRNGRGQAQELAGPRLEGVVRHEAMFWEELADKKVKCVLCPRECEVADVERGYCGVRENQGGRYQTLVYGTVCSANVDPIEKKPLFHYLPGTTAMSIATAGCNIECKFCQNWEISQFRPEQVDSILLTPDRLIEICNREGAPTIAHTYSEPVVFYEYMHDVAKLGRSRGVGNVMISNGYIQEEPLRELCRHITGVKIDLKAFTESFYKEQCNGELAPVLKTLETLKNTGIWFEIVVLVIPTLNDSAEEIREMSRWVVEHLGPDVPMHFSRFHPTYRVTNLPRTPIATVENCRRLAMEAGVHYVYAGNVPMHPGENTYCHHCSHTLIERAGYRIINNLIESGKCPQCQTAIPGVWTREQTGVRL